MSLPHIHDADDIPPGNYAPPFLVYPFARAKSLTLVSAEPYTGKSALATAIACALRYRKPLLGAEPPGGRVLYLALDAARWDYLGLLFKITRGLQATPRRAPDGEPPSLGMVFDRINVLEPPTHLGAILDSLRPTITWRDEFDVPQDLPGLRPDLVIIDTLLNIHTLDENENRAMSRVMDVLRDVANSGTAVVLLHHTAKNPNLTGGYSARGATVIPGSVDIHILLKRVAAAPNSTTIKARWVKGRGGDCPDTLTYTMAWDGDTLTFALPAAKKDWTLDPGVGYSWNELAAGLHLRGDQLTREITALGLTKGPDKLWRIA